MRFSVHDDLMGCNGMDFDGGAGADGWLVGVEARWFLGFTCTG